MKTPRRLLKTTSAFLIAVATARLGPAAASAQEAAPPPAGAVIPFRAPSSAPGDRLRALVERPEVQSHLKLTVRQKAELGLNPKSEKSRPGDLSNRSRAMPVPAEGEKAPSEERQKQVEEAAAGLSDKSPAQSQARASKIKDVLTPDQYARLLELDLQRRGLLALGDPAVAEQIKLDAAKRAPVAALASEAQRKIDEAFSEALLGADAGETGPRPAAGRVEQFQRDMKNRLSPIRQKTDKVKKEAEAEILLLLSDEEQTRWQAAQGEPFSFRTDR